MTLPILYSFRRCPYAIRSRLALAYSAQCIELREVTLKNKPIELIQASAKGTVPVLVLEGHTVLDESLDIIHWALSINDPDGWLISSPEDEIKSQQLISENDTSFKAQLDHYKYAERFPEFNAEHYRTLGEDFLQKLEYQLSQHKYLISTQLKLTDIAIFPFIRQFALVDKDWFDQAPYPHLQSWLNEFLHSTLFSQVMIKSPAWQNGLKTTIYG